MRAPDPEFKIVNVTPEMAADWLGRKRPNRPLRQRVVSKIQRDIEAGNWRMTGDAIKFGSDGLLDDGQHRLAAIVASEKTVPCLVMTGLGPDARHLVDTGTPRKYGDMLAMGGYSESQGLAALTKRMWHWERGDYVVRGIRTVPSTSELDAYLAENLDDLQHAVKWSRPVYKDTRISPTSLASIQIVLNRSKHSDKAHRFLDGWITGISLEAGSPILALRNRLIKNDSEPKTVRIAQDDRVGLAYAAWRNFVQGTKVSTLNIPTGGFTKRNFPVPD
jgi:hypothetical protein